MAKQRWRAKLLLSLGSKLGSVGASPSLNFSVGRHSEVVLNPPQSLPVLFPCVLAFSARREPRPPYMLPSVWPTQAMGPEVSMHNYIATSSRRACCGLDSQRCFCANLFSANLLCARFLRAAIGAVAHSIGSAARRFAAPIGRFESPDRAGDCRRTDERAASDRGHGCYRNAGVLNHKRRPCPCGLMAAIHIDGPKQARGKPSD
jgi:hypothetical protein